MINYQFKKIMSYSAFDYNDPEDLVKNLSKDIVDVIYVLTFPKNKFRKNLFPVEDRWKFIKSVELTEDSMKFIMENKSELEKFRTVLKMHDPRIRTDYSKNATFLLERKWDNKIFKGSKGYYQFHNIEVVYVSIFKGEEDCYYAKTDYIFYPVIEIYFEAITEDLINIIVSKINNSKALISLDKTYDLSKINFNKLLKDRYSQPPIPDSSLIKTAAIMRKEEISWKEAYMGLLAVEERVGRKISGKDDTFTVNLTILDSNAMIGALLLSESGYPIKMFIL